MSTFLRSHTVLLVILVSSGHLGNGDLLKTKEAMAEKDAFLVDDVEGGLCVDYTDAGIGGRCNSGSDTNKGQNVRMMTTYAGDTY
ncbi:hypothetical protein Tco_0904127 [Tanacetum coccineum]